MPRKPYAKMTDKELLRRLFSKPVRQQVKKILLELNAEKQYARKARKH